VRRKEKESLPSKEGKGKKLYRGRNLRKLREGISLSLKSAAQWKELYRPKELIPNLERLRRKTELMGRDLSSEEGKVLKS